MYVSFHKNITNVRQIIPALHSIEHFRWELYLFHNLWIISKTSEAWNSWETYCMNDCIKMPKLPDLRPSSDTHTQKLTPKPNFKSVTNPSDFHHRAILTLSRLTICAVWAAPGLLGKVCGSVAEFIELDDGIFSASVASFGDFEFSLPFDCGRFVVIWLTE